MVIWNPDYRGDDRSGDLPNFRNPNLAFENSGEGPGQPVPNVTYTYDPPPAPVPVSRDRYGGDMPFDNSFTDARGSLLGSVIRFGVGALGSLVQGKIPGLGADWCKDHPGDMGCVLDATTGGGKVIQPFSLQAGLQVQGTALRGCAPCAVARPVKATTRNYKGRWCMNAQGQAVCVPRRRKINPMNGRAAIRAASRLKGVFKFQRRVEKALQKACRGSGVRRARAGAARRCKKCG